MKLNVNVNVKPDQQVLEMLTRLVEQGERMAATISEIKAELAQILQNVKDANTNNATVVAGLKDQIAALKLQVASGSGVTQADLDAVDKAADDIIAVQTGTPAPAPVEEPPAGGGI